MIDLVAAEGLPRSSGISAAVPMAALKNFRKIAAASQAKPECRTKHALIYSASYELDGGALKDLEKSGGALLFSFCDLIREQGFRRAIVLSKMRLALAQCRKAGCGFAACTLAGNANETRNAREIKSFMAELGMDQHERKRAGEILEKLAVL